jgi:penicillin-binding protein-related factor A (putative recombinase)
MEMSGYANRGKVLEGACILGAREYERTGRASVFHRPTKRVWDARRNCYVYLEKAGCDFSGNVDGTAITFEAKETATDSLPLANIKPHQVDALFANRKGISGLVVGFMSYDPLEVYWIPYPALAEFLANKWRESLSLEWCRTYGELCRLETNAAGKLRVMFLATEPHPLRADAHAAVTIERLQGRKEPVKRARKDMPRTADGKLDLIGGIKWGQKARGIK